MLIISSNKYKLQSKIDGLLLGFRKGLDIIIIMILILFDKLILLDVVEHMPESHLSLGSTLTHLLLICNFLSAAELVL